MLLNTSSYTLGTERPNKPKCQSLEQRKVFLQGWSRRTGGSWSKPQTLRWFLGKSFYGQNLGWGDFLGCSSFVSTFPPFPDEQLFWICLLELRQGQGGWMKPISYKQEMAGGGMERIYSREGPSGSCSISVRWNHWIWLWQECWVGRKVVRGERWLMTCWSAPRREQPGGCCCFWKGRSRVRVGPFLLLLWNICR